MFNVTTGRASLYKSLGSLALHKRRTAARRGQAHTCRQLAAKVLQKSVEMGDTNIVVAKEV